jgi:hypothetical protein
MVLCVNDLRAFVVGTVVGGADYSRLIIICG